MAATSLRLCKTWVNSAFYLLAAKTRHFLGLLAYLYVLYGNLLEKPANSVHIAETFYDKNHCLLPDHPGRQLQRCCPDPQVDYANLYLYYCLV